MSGWNLDFVVMDWPVFGGVNDQSTVILGRPLLSTAQETMNDKEDTLTIYGENDALSLKLSMLSQKQDSEVAKQVKVVLIEINENVEEKETGTTLTCKKGRMLTAL